MSKPFHFLKWSSKKAVACFVLTLVLALATVGSTLAYIIVKTNSVENQFEAPNVDIVLDGNAAQNQGDVPLYVRAAVVATWVSTEDGSTLSVTPTVSVTQSNGWVKGSDGFFYYREVLDVNESSAPVSSVTTSDTAPEGYRLNVRVLVEAIQTTPAEAVTTRWGAVDGIDANGNLIINAN